MGYNISQLKAQYYPTNNKICEFFNFLHFPIIHEDELVSKMWMGNDKTKLAKQNIETYMNYMQTKVYKFKKDWFKIPSYSTYKFQEEFIKTDIGNIKEYNLDVTKLVAYCNIYSSKVNISILDGFAGKGEWLVSFRKYYKDLYYPKIKTLGIELVKERSDALKTNKVDYNFNYAFEDVYIPRKSISLIYFNPPYDSINKERLTKIYLQDIIDREILVECESMVDFVIRDDDFVDCMELLLDHFSIISDTLFKAPSEEFSKFKQVVFTARFKRKSKPTLDTRWLISGRQDIKNELMDRLKNLETIDLMKIPNETIDGCRKLPSVYFIKKMESLKLKNNNSKKISEKNDMSWSWFKEFTKIDTSTINNIVLGKAPKNGEIVNIIASGLLNQRIEDHVVAGGTEQITETIKSIKINDDGKECEQIEVRKINKPYLNVLLPTGEIKKLLNKTESED